jgi:hypothetical protein
MVLGDGALTDHISPVPALGAGVGFVPLGTSPGPVRVRAAHVSDDIRARAAASRVGVMPGDGSGRDEMAPEKIKARVEKLFLTWAFAMRAGDGNRTRAVSLGIAGIGSRGPADLGGRSVLSDRG